jgi:DNA-binding CsgD family transcriptional regulator
MVSADSEVVGREDEIAAVLNFLQEPSAFPGALLLEGETGIGKTTLWQRGLELASALSYRVLSCSPSGTEARLSFAALGDMLEPVLDDMLPALPTPQARALAVALLLEDADGPPPDQRAVALAFLGAIRALAEEVPVVIAVDDIQWLDDPSAFVLEFALRRLRDEPVAVLVSLRAGHDETLLGFHGVLPQEGAQRIVVEPLSMGAIHRLLSERLSLVLSRPKLRRLYELSGGNPFFALELGRAVGRGAIQLEPGESLPRRLASLVNDRIVALPEDTRAALLIASALSQPTIQLVGRTGVEEPAKQLLPALEAHVIDLEDDRIRFSHPLIASGVYSMALPWDRRAVHRRLADAVPDPEERARHLALGAEGPDPDVASALEDAAGRAHLRGALRAAAELAVQAWRLTPLDRRDDRHRRAIQSVAHAFETGDSSRAGALLEETLGAAPAGLPRAQALYWLGLLQEYKGDRRRAVELFRAALLESGDDVALRAKLEGGLADILFLMRKDLPQAAQHARTAVALAEQTGDPSAQVTAVAQQGLIEAMIGRLGWRDALRRGIVLEREADSIDLTGSASFSLAVNLMWVDEFDEARTIFRSLRDRASERAEESSLPWILANLSLVEYLSGRWEEASLSAEEGSEIALQTGQEPQRLYALGVRALVRCSRGEESARSDAHIVLDGAEEYAAMISSILAASALGLLELAHDRPDAAHRILGPIGKRLEEGGVREPGSMRFVADDVEALIALDRLGEAEALLARLERRARRLDRVSARAAAARCRGLLASRKGDLDEAIASFEEALAEHARVPIPFERARTLLVLGSTHRRAKRRRVARESLEEALSIFDELGARAWAEKARGGLARIGGRPAASGDLTPTEHRIAALVAEGHPNKEVAARLFVTVKTVEANLSRVYAKLGIRSRAELAHRFAAQGPENEATKH